MAKPRLTGSHHLLPFDRLSPADFERLCLWLVRREGRRGRAGARHRGLARWPPGRLPVQAGRPSGPQRGRERDREATVPAADRAFAFKLYERLKAEGVSCWLYDHDMNPGEVELDTADRAIREAEKLLLCCSETSLRSWWVNDELDKAIEKERDHWKDKRLVLIPLKLDDHLWEWESGKASIVRSRHPADFVGWKSDLGKFDAQVQRVLSALKMDALRGTASAEAVGRGDG